MQRAILPIFWVHCGRKCAVGGREPQPIDIALIAAKLMAYERGSALDQLDWNFTGPPLGVKGRNSASGPFVETFPDLPNELPFGVAHDQAAVDTVVANHIGRQRHQHSGTREEFANLGVQLDERHIEPCRPVEERCRNLLTVGPGSEACHDEVSKACVIPANVHEDDGDVVNTGRLR